MTKELNRLSLAIIVCFVLVGLSAGYWGVFQKENILQRKDNPRRVLAEQSLIRGDIVDRNGILLATGSQLDRHYPNLGVEGAVGYYSYRFGAAGLEAAYNDILIGDFGEQDSFQAIEDDLLHRSQVGYDLRSTIDLNIQQAINTSLGLRDGAVLVVHVPSGRILAMVSHPSYDPNTLELYVEKGVNGRPVAIAPNSPLYNRVRQGGYQPGGAIDIVLLAGLLTNNVRLDTLTPEATQTIEIDGTQLPAENRTCLSPPDTTTEMTLKDSFAFTCPQPFMVALGDILPLDIFQNFLQTLGLLAEPPLERVETGVGPAPIPLLVETTEQVQLEAIGQGTLTFNPLQMARVMAAIANQGNVPIFHLADAYRTNPDEEWQKLALPIRRPAILLPEVSLQMRDALLTATQKSPFVMAAQRSDFAIRDHKLYGHSAIATSGDSQLSWFNGFLDLGNGESLVVIVVVENAQNPDEAAIVAGDALQATILALEEDDTPFSTE